jgi:site-specific recombinase XerD
MRPPDQPSEGARAPGPAVTGSSLVPAAPAETASWVLVESADSAVLTERLLAYSSAAHGAFAANTGRAIRADFRRWRAWCAERGARVLPADPADVARFVDAMAEERAPATIRRYLATLAHLHRAAELPDPTKAQRVRLALRRMHRSKGRRQRQVAPLTRTDVQRILPTLGRSLIDLRDRALLLAARDLLARRSEVSALRVEDLTWAPDGSATALFHRSKTDQEGEGTVGYLGREAAPAVRTWLDASGVETGAVFRAVHRTGRLGGALASGDVARVLKKLARRAGLESAGEVAGHSCRVGMAQDLVAANADLPAVMQAGRWKTAAMPARYAERLRASQGAVAQYYAGRGDEPRGGGRDH